MKKALSSFTTFLILAAVLVITSCAKDKQTQLAGTTWEVTGMTSGGLINSLSPPLPITLSFSRVGDVLLKLDVNTCNSTFKVENSDKISIEPFGCTKMCCDNATSELVKSALPAITGFRIMHSQLELTGPGKTITLKKKVE